METLFSILFAILGLGIIVFIHELGHYFVARKEGMRVEAFSIGFGKPIVTWMRGDVKWMICILPFGGYVKIAGMSRENQLDPHEIPDGFYGKRPIQRIRVAFAGPFVNIVFSFLLFTALWLMGGREKSFSEVTHRIGLLDQESELYQLGVRPGDWILRYGDSSFQGFKDLLVSSLMKKESIHIEGDKIDPVTGEKHFFDYDLKSYPLPFASKLKMQTIGVLSPASYLYVTKLPSESIKASGIECNDRIVWASGERVYSVQQLSMLVNENTAWLTIDRKGSKIQQKVPRLRIEDLRLTSYEKAEIGDWQYEEKIKGKLQELYFIPYALSPSKVVERKLEIVDPDVQKKAMSYPSLEEGDRILAIDGIPITSSYQFLAEIQTPKTLLIVERNGVMKPLSSQDADAKMDNYSFEDLQSLVRGIGSEEVVSQKKQLHLLSSIPATFQGDRLILGVGLTDQKVIYNPGPIQLFKTALLETWKTLSALFSGNLNPKYMSGPVGIVQVVHQSWMVGFKEAIFWLGLISLNLGVVNLLPIPVLDGGHIVISSIEMIRKKPFSAKFLERLIIPFVGLMIFFFIYITFQDITRLLGKWL